MTKRDRIKAALAGDPVDRVPISFWRHWPIDDQSAEGLARATMDYQRKYDFDWIKVTASSTYCVEDFGAEHVYRGAPLGERQYPQRLIQKVEDWDKGILSSLVDGHPIGVRS